MCKVLFIAGITPKTNKKAQALMKAMAEPMSQGNTDGLGYSAVKANGAMFGQRWWINSHAFRAVPPKIVEADYKELMTELGGAIVAENYTPIDHALVQNNFGEVNLDDMVAVTMHTRMATSGREFENTHPFVDTEADTSLIHNGVIRNTNDFKFNLSSCDSEAILISYLKQNVGHDIKSVGEMAKMLRGYYTCGVFGRDTEGSRVMDIFKSNARLSGVFVKELETIVYSTDSDDIIAVCRRLGYTIGQKFKFNDGWAARINPVTGRVLTIAPFKESETYISYGSGATQYNSGTSSASSNEYNDDEYGYSGYRGHGPHYNRGATGSSNGNNNTCQLSPPDSVSSSKGSKRGNVIGSIGKQKNMSRDMIAYMKIEPKTRVLTSVELLELNRDLAAVG